MASSNVFKKMLSSEKVGVDTAVSKASGGLQSFDKKMMNAGVHGLVVRFLINLHLHSFAALSQWHNYDIYRIHNNNKT